MGAEGQANTTVNTVTFADMDGQAEALLACRAFFPERTESGIAYLHTRDVKEFAAFEPLAGLQISSRDQLVVLDIDSDGDLDAIWFGQMTPQPSAWR